MEKEEEEEVKDWSWGTSEISLNICCSFASSSTLTTHESVVEDSTMADSLSVGRHKCPTFTFSPLVRPNILPYCTCSPFVPEEEEVVEEGGVGWKEMKAGKYNW